MKIRKFLSLALASILAACGNSQVSSDNAAKKPATITNAPVKIVLASEIKFDKLNPARGDKSPQAGTVWGDRNGKEATGFIFKPTDGFSSPPHIHNVSYRGIVISGIVHNDDPKAEEMWLPAGSYWTQPKGAVHITSAKGSNTLAYIEIEEGPYLVRPIEKAFDSGEKPVNVDVSNLVWLDASGTNWIDKVSDATSGPKIAFLWGKPTDNQLNGTLIKLPAGFKGELHNYADTFGAVVIKGQLGYQQSDKVKTLDPSSYFSTKGERIHKISSKADNECWIYVRSKGKLTVTPSTK
ncbi:hypothetical protein BKI52_00215 [marine bacterium AO1-C]|nr:hypothetical protein BKI52_00215 [marine bacterium AO1-C]